MVRGLGLGVVRGLGLGGVRLSLCLSLVGETGLSGEVRDRYLIRCLVGELLLWGAVACL